MNDSFSGGLEMLFSNQRQHQLSIPATDESGDPANAGFLVRYLCQHLMNDRRKELFVLDETVYVFISCSLDCLFMCLNRLTWMIVDDLVSLYSSTMPIGNWKGNININSNRGIIFSLCLLYMVVDASILLKIMLSPSSICGSCIGVHYDESGVASSKAANIVLHQPFLTGAMDGGEKNKHEWETDRLCSE